MSDEEIARELISVNSVSNFLFIDAKMTEQLKTKLPLYQAKCADTDENFCTLKCGKQIAQNCQLGQLVL